MLGIDREHDELQQTVLRGCQTQVCLFSSRDRWQAWQCSDDDMVVLPFKPFPPRALSAIREAPEESRIPYWVDVVNFSEAASAFRKRVIKEGIPWTYSKSD